MDDISHPSGRRLGVGWPFSKHDGLDLAVEHALTPRRSRSPGSKSPSPASSPPTVSECMASLTPR